MSRLLVILYIFPSFFLFAQDADLFGADCSIIKDKKTIKAYNKGMDMAAGRFDKVKYFREVVLEIEPDLVNVHYFIGNYYFELLYGKRRDSRIDGDKRVKMESKCREAFNRVYDLCPSFNSSDVVYQLAVIHDMKGEEKDALRMYNNFLKNEAEPYKKYKEQAERRQRELNLIVALKENPVPFNPEKLKGLNTKYDEYLAMLSPDNEYMYFTRESKGKCDPKAIVGEDYCSRFSEAKRMNADSFSIGMALPQPFNDKNTLIEGMQILDQGGVTITPDNKEMYVALTYGNFRDRNTDIYYSRNEDGMWQPLESVGAQINGNPSWEGQPTISSDGKLMIFASARETSQGHEVDGFMQYSMDLYMSEKQENGYWGKPKNLGGRINTPGNEKTPFLHSDSRTLYFSSNGHPGVGGQDIFFSKMNDNGEWTTPKNIGYPINTENDEHGFFVSLDGKQGFLTSGTYHGDDGALDIISFPIPEKARPEKVVFMKGQLKDSDGNVVKDGKVEIKNSETGEVTEALVDPESGEYVAVMTVPRKKKTAIKNIQSKQLSALSDDELLTLKSMKKEEDLAVIEEYIKAERPHLESLSLDNRKIETLKESVTHKLSIIQKADEMLEEDKKRSGGEDMTATAADIDPLENGGLQEGKIDESGMNLDERDDIEALDEGEPKEVNWIVTAKKEGSVFSSKRISVDTDEIDGAKKVKGVDMAIDPIETGKPYRINDLSFETDSYVLNVNCILILTEFIEFLRDNEKINIEIHGHTDNVGDATKNMTLSTNRAKTVYEFLKNHGVNSTRMSYKGFGANKPVESNSTEVGRAKNRRTEFIIMN